MNKGDILLSKTKCPKNAHYVILMGKRADSVGKTLDLAATGILGDRSTEDTPIEINKKLSQSSVVARLGRVVDPATAVASALYSEGSMRQGWRTWTIYDMSGKRRAGGPVRQLSLQQSARRHPRGKEDSNQSRLRRQVSEDHGLRVLASHIVTPGECERPRREPQPAIVRPRPIRLAWAERRQATLDPDPSLGVVVQRCKGLPRPVTAKPVRTSAAPDSILYSRQELAERLRLAWKDRQERPNLDIFLAHNSLDKSDPEEAVLSVREIQTEVEKNKFVSSEDLSKSSRFTPFSEVVKTPSTGVKSSEVFIHGTIRRREGPPEVSQYKVSSIHTFPTTTFPLVSFRDSSDSEKDIPATQTASVTKVESSRKLTPSITISFDHGIDSDDQRTGNENDEDVAYADEQSHHLLKPDSYSQNEVNGNNNIVEIAEEKKTDKFKEVEKSKKDHLTATMRRANFKNMNNNPVMSGTITSATPPPTPATPVRPILKKLAGQPLQRMMSAPAAGRTPPQRKDTVAPRPEAINDSIDFEFDEDDMAIVQRETRVKSAPARRRFKSGKKKGTKGHEDDSSEDEFGCPEDVPAAAKPRHRKRFVEKTTEIVTMVSLLSPNESEAEDPPDPVIQLPPDTSWSTARTVAHETKKTEAKEAEAKVGPATVSAANILCLRKFPVKTVSFQQGAPPHRNYTASYPSRRGVGTPMILPPPDPTPPPAPPLVPPPPPPLARRRLTKARSTGNMGQENSVDGEPVAEVEDTCPVAEVESASPLPPAPTTPQAQSSPYSGVLDPSDDPSIDPDTEPSFKTDKERECWQMFRKMADKGVSVSYDTVLRGMMTPTEYRLHKKSMSSTC